MKKEEAIQIGTQTQEQFLQLLDNLPVKFFEEEYENLYGKVHPKFYRGKCQEAVAESKKKFVPLIVYLHHEEHENTSSFCKEVLSSPSLSKIVDDHFLFWVGIINSDLENLIKTFLGSTKYPFITIVANLGLGMSVLDILQGVSTSSEVMSRLLQILETYTQTFAKLKQDSKKRDHQRSIVAEQDEEFQRFLAIDKEKERIREELEDKEKKRKGKSRSNT